MEGPGIDITNYLSWPKVNGPAGGVYYAVPNSDLVYDPVQTQSSGRHTFHPNPQPAIDAKNKQDKDTATANSPLHQVVPVVSGVAGTVGGAYVIHEALGGSTPVGPAQLVNGRLVTTMSDGSVIDSATHQVISAPSSNVGSFSNSVTPGLSAPPGTPVVTPAAPSPVAIGQNADGSLIYDTQGSNVGAFNSGVTGSPPGTPNVISAQEVPIEPGTPIAEVGTPSYAGYGAAALEGYNALTGLKGRTSDDRVDFVRQKGELAAADIFTAGLASAADGLTSKFAPGLNKSFWGIEDKLANGFGNEGLSWLMSPGTQIAKKLKLFGDLTTKQEQTMNWAKLAQEGTITPEQFQAKVADIHREDRGIDFNTGKAWDLKTAQDRVKNGGAAADEFGQVIGNYKTFGKDWDTYTADQKRQIIAANAQEGNFSSHKGDVFYGDEDKARQIKDQVLSGAAPSSSQAVTSAPTPVVASHPLITPIADSSQSLMKSAPTPNQILGQQLAARINARHNGV